MTAHLRPLDLAIVAAYLVAITLFGLRFREKKGAGKADRSLKSYFLANNTIPWWAIALSIVSAETSTLTIISIPGVAFAGDFGFLQIVLGYMLGRIVVAVLFLPRYFKGEMLTAYQLIDQRFGPVLHKVTAGLFLLTRAAAEGVRVFAVSIVVGIAIGTGDVLSIGIISALTLLYTFEGGMAAVIWTDVVQMTIYIGGTFVAIWSLGRHVPGGWSTIHAVAGAAGKFHMLNFAFNLTTTYTFWAGVLGGTFLTMASHGTDQLMVQRMLAARSLRESRLALLSSGVVIFVQFTLFLLIGAGLYVFYGQHSMTFASSDRIFPSFIVHELPIGIAGLLVAAILAAAMSNLSAALNSLSSTTVVDFYMRLRPAADDQERNLISKSSTVLWALVLFAIAVYSLSVGGKGHVVEIGLSIASVAYGCLLGVFLLGTLTKFATEIGTAIGMLCGFALNLWLWQGTFPKVLWQSSVTMLDCQPSAPAKMESPNNVHLFLSCPPPAHTITIPHIAFTWYVLIGALVTFAIGALASLVFRKQSKRTMIAAVLLPLFFAVILNAVKDPRIVQAQTASTAPDFTPVSTLITDAIAAHKLPGAVVVIGHNGKVVFEHAYGNRKLAGEPGLDGKPSPAEPMTEDTIFDMASLTKDLATATAVMQLYEAGKIDSFDDPVEKYLPAFNAQHDPLRSQVTLRMLLTHTSGAAPDVDLKDAWGLAKPDKAEGIHRALTTPLKDKPGAVFTYSDINFILLGYLVETLSGQPEDVYVREHIFAPLGMTETRYLPVDKACGPHRIVGAAIVWQPAPSHAVSHIACPLADWPTGLLERIAPTTHDDESKANPSANPHFDMLTRGTVHDPTTRRMGGVAGHAGVFSTAHDVSLYANALLEKLLRNTGPFPLKQSTLELMTRPEQPGGDITQQIHAGEAEIEAISKTPSSDPLLAPSYPAIKGQNLRGFGWDIDTAFSKPRGVVFPIGSFGHTGFTGTSLWMDPMSDTYVILLANAIHPRGNPTISNLRGELASTAAHVLHLYPCGLAPYGTILDCVEVPVKKQRAIEGSGENSEPGAHPSPVATQTGSVSTVVGANFEQPRSTLTGIDVLESTHFAALKGLHHIGLLTNQSGIDARRRRTVDVLFKDLSEAVQTAHLTTLFSPEHGINGALDTDEVSSSTDTATHLPVISLYGSKESDRRPTHAQLAGLDAVVIDLQDAGVRFWTYEAAVSYFLEAASVEKVDYQHELEIILLDRPNLVGGVAVQGPVSDPGSESYVNAMPLPVRHGLTFGELARYFVVARHLDTKLSVVPMQHWTRGEYFADTGLPWVNPSPNLRSPDAAIVYPALGLIEYANISVGRGTEHPFGFFGAAWMNAEDVATALSARKIAGVTFTAASEAIAEDANHYPFHGQTIPAVHLAVTDRAAFDSPETGVEILAVLHRLYPTLFLLAKDKNLLCNRSTLDAITRGEDPRAIAATWAVDLKAFHTASSPYLLYP